MLDPRHLHFIGANAVSRRAERRRSRCVCHAERAPASNDTEAADACIVSLASKSGVTRTVPVKLAAGPCCVSRAPLRVMIIFCAVIRIGASQSVPSVGGVQENAGRIKLRTNPANVTAHAAIAITTNARGMNIRNGVALTAARRNVQTVYIPNGKTAPQ
jgi:hypothetical protein